MGIDGCRWVHECCMWHRSRHPSVRSRRCSPYHMNVHAVRVHVHAACSPCRRSSALTGRVISSETRCVTGKPPRHLQASAQGKTAFTVTRSHLFAKRYVVQFVTATSDGSNPHVRTGIMAADEDPLLYAEASRPASWLTTVEVRGVASSLPRHTPGYMESGRSFDLLPSRFATPAPSAMRHASSAVAPPLLVRAPYS